LADLLGPTGQPLQPNPFQQPQQNLSGTVSVNTQPAERAFADLQKVLDGLMKQFGVNWDKASHDGMAAQERFWHYIGDKQKEQEQALKRYNSEAIKGIQAERDAAIAALDAQKMAAGDLAREKDRIVKEAAKKELDVTVETERKKRQSTGYGGMVRGAGDVLSKVGGPLGGMATSIANLVANPEVAIPATIIGSLLELASTHARFAETGARLAGAGFGLGAGNKVGENFDLGLFGPKGAKGFFGAALSSDEQRRIIATMAGSRTMIDEAREKGGFGAIRGNLGLFANVLPDAAKEMELFTAATKDLGMSQKDITNTFISSRVNSERVKITQLDAISTQMEMQKALRNITNDGLVAANVLGNVGSFLERMGTTSEGERNRMTLGIAQAGANLSLSQIAGMFAFTHGGRIPNPEQVFGEGGVLKHGGVFGLMGGFLQQIGNQFKDPTQRMFAADALRQQFMPSLRLQDVPQFFSIANAMQQRGANMEDLTKQFEALEKKTPQVAMSEGINTLVQIVGPIKQLENVFTNFWTALDARINRILSHFHMPSLGNFMPFSKWTDPNVTPHKPSAQSTK
jgi:hypothetical protein